MKTLLLVHTSLQGATSLSSSLAHDYVEQWQANNPLGRLISRDLAIEPVPHLNAERFAAFSAAGETFRYTSSGAVGLLTGKRAIVFATRGGKYQGTPLDTQTDFMKTVLAFLGIDDTQFIYAEGTAMGATNLETAIQNARQQIRAIAA